MTFSDDVRRRLSGWEERFAPIIACLEGSQNGNLDEARAAYTSYLADELVPPSGVGIEVIRAEGMAMTVVSPEATETDRAILYIHGGGYVSGSALMYRRLAANLAIATRAKVFIPNYRLAPEHPFPASLEDVLAAYRWLLEQGWNPQRIAFAGDSAGGAMVVSIMVKARNAGLPLPVAGAAFSPWANLQNDGASMYLREDSKPGFRYALDVLARRFLDGAPRNDPDASPVFADVRKLPPILVQIGEDEAMMSDAVRLVGHLADNRVRTTLEVWPAMFHVWHLFDDILPDAARAVTNAARFIEDAFDTAI
jgi:acetyl esterase/lipase